MSSTRPLPTPAREFNEHVVAREVAGPPSPASPARRLGRGLRGARCSTRLLAGRRPRALRQLSVDQVREDLTTTALRGGIYDRDGQILAVSRPTSLVIADDFQIKHPSTEAAGDVAARERAGRQAHRACSRRQSGYVIVNNALNLNGGRRVSSPRVSRASSCRTPRCAPTRRDARDVAAGWGKRERLRVRPGLEYEYQKLLAGQTGITREFVSASGVALPARPRRS